ncbi:MAG TPA: hypothetical protein VFK88_07545 [Gallionella sp.]|nr:hypothetical protein [Gallionella sp.]
MKWERLAQTDRIVISDSLGREKRTIQDKATIEKITAFALSYRSGWETPWGGTPVALVRADFYVGSKFLGDLSVGSNFLTAQGCGYFQSLKVSAQEREAVMSLFAVKDPYSDK